MITLQQISKRFGDQPVVEEINLEVKSNAVLGILGPGGGGKSVLLKIMCGLIRPDSGSVLVDGKNILTMGQLELARVRGKYGVLFQNSALFDFMTVGENIAFPLTRIGVKESEIGRKVTSILEDVGLSKTDNLFPNELSGGMKKRVSLARACVTGPQILLCDDPTAGLDPVTSSKIFKLIKKMHDENHSTTVVISHDVDRMVQICDYYAMILKGRLIFSGTIHDAKRADHPDVIKFFHGGT